MKLPLFCLKLSLRSDAERIASEVRRFQHWVICSTKCHTVSLFTFSNILSFSKYFLVFYLPAELRLSMFLAGGEVV